MRWLDPVEQGTQDAPGGAERSIDRVHRTRDVSDRQRVFRHGELLDDLIAVLEGAVVGPRGVVLGALARHRVEVLRLRLHAAPPGQVR
jgi:hypothetical protein